MKVYGKKWRECKKWARKSVRYRGKILEIELYWN